MEQRPRPRRRRGLGAIFAIGFLLAGCTGAMTPSNSDSAPGDELRIATSIYPVTFLAEEIAGADAQVFSLIPPGADAHHVEISLRQLRKLQEADVLVYLSDFQPAIDQAVAANPPPQLFDIADHLPLKSYEASPDDPGTGHDHHGTRDPHFWLDLNHMSTMAEELGEQFAVLNPQNAASFRERARNLATDLDELAAEYRQKLQNCAQDTLIVSHAAFGYLTEPLGLTQIGIAGLDPDSEPSLARIREIRDFVAEYQVSTIFYDSPANPFVAQKVADSLGLQTAFLDPLEIQHHPDKDYVTVMEDNLATLHTALECE